jgi:hypothetical protein
VPTEINPEGLLLCRRLADVQGILLKSNQYEGCDSTLEWYCKLGHYWEASLHYQQANTGCAECSAAAKAQDICKKWTVLAKTIAESRGGLCLSAYASSAKSRLNWKCSYGHEWQASLHSVHYMDSWCPYCNVLVRESLCRNIIEKLTGLKFSKIKPKWLRNREGNQLELDGYNAGLGIAFEHNGRQHYEDVEWFDRAGRGLGWRQENDKYKKSLAAINNVHIISIKHDISVNSLVEYITVSLESLGFYGPFPIININKLRCYDKKDSLIKIRTYAETMGGACASDTWLGGHEPHKFICKYGHEWSAKPSTMLSSRTWCNHSDCVNIRIKAARNYPNRLEDLKKAADLKGGKLLSTVYTTTDKKYKFVCARGHEFRSVPDPILNRGSWCKKCQRLSIEQMRSVAEKRGGLCLSTEYTANNKHLSWKCSKGHVWTAQPRAIYAQGQWCPYCSGRRK